MESDAAENKSGSEVAMTDKQNHLRRFLEAESKALIGTLRTWVWKAGLATGGDVNDAAIELLSQIVIEALAHADRFDPSRQPRAWLLGIAVNLIKRKKAEAAKRLTREPLVSELVKPADGASDEEFFDRIMESGRANPMAEMEGRAQAEAMLALVTEDERQVIRLAVLEELDGDELARALDIKPGAARVRLHRALNHLREQQQAQS